MGSKIQSPNDMPFESQRNTHILVGAEASRRMWYSRYGHDLTKIFHILVEINHIVFKKQQTLSFQMNDHIPNTNSFRCRCRSGL